MKWPDPRQYAEVVQNPSIAFSDLDMRSGTVAMNAMGLPLTWPGNFAAVFQMRGRGGQLKWAAKCFTREVADLQERYRQIHLHLEQNRSRLPFMVEFSYLPEEVLVGQNRFPVLKMDWAEGLRLDEFLNDCLTKRNYQAILRTLCSMWLRLEQRLREAHVGHGDIQHGNVMLVPDRVKQGALNLKLIDYDGMYVPALAGQPPSEIGHGAYQHPARTRFHGYGPDVDRFSHLLIYTTFRSLILGGRELWQRHYDGDRLLFGRRDLETPGKSTVFKELWSLADEPVRHLVGHLILAASGKVQDVPPLSDVVGDLDVVKLTESKLRQVEQLLSPARKLPQVTANPSTRRSEATQPAAERKPPTPARPVVTDDLDARLTDISRPSKPPALPAAKAESFERITGTLVLQTPQVQEPGLSLSVACGLALQGLGRSQIQTNLMPQQGLFSRLQKSLFGGSGELAWGIDLGNTALKAVQLQYQRDQDVVSAVASDYLEHAKILSQPDANSEELIASTLETFVSRNNFKGSRVCIGLPTPNVLFRTFYLPPIESKKIRGVIEFEARQQIPFPLDDVFWDYHLFNNTEEGGLLLDCEVGLSAIKRDLAQRCLTPFERLGIKVDATQNSALALYNLTAYESRLDQLVPESKEAIVTLDIGTDTTTFIAGGSKAPWIRSIPLGGNHFTRALAKEFRLTFAKAEHLKRNARNAVELRAVFQAMRAVFNDLLTEVQRSMGFWKNLHREISVSRIQCLGNGSKLPGLTHYLEVNLQ